MHGSPHIGHQAKMVRGGQADRTVRRSRILALAKVTFCGNEVLKLLSVSLQF